MASIPLPFYFVAIAAAGCIATVASLTCLQCDEVSHPQFCQFAVECQPGQVCVAESITKTDDIPAYRVGCTNIAACRNSTEYACAECCSTDMCNANSCNDEALQRRFVDVVSGVWMEWGAWHHCTATCGGGTRTRSRTCKFPPHTAQGKYCEGSSRERGVCNTQPCP